MDDQAHHLFLHSVPPDNPVDPGPLPMTSLLTSALARLAATGMDNNHEVLPPSVASMVEKFRTDKLVGRLTRSIFYFPRKN
jgi:hypothetical protein